MPHSAGDEPNPEQRASHGEVLAWVCLLCWAKAFGRAGRVRVVKSDFASRFHLSMRSVEGMLERARKCAAVVTDGEFVTVCNWGTYQGKASSAKYRKSSSNSETSPTSTRHQAPGTKHKEPPNPPSGGKPPPKNPRRKRFTKPTVEQVQAYCVERGNSVDPQRFVDFYESKSWKVGKNPMSDWQASVRTWERRDSDSETATGESRILTDAELENWTPE